MAEPIHWNAPDGVREIIAARPHVSRPELIVVVGKRRYGSHFEALISRAVLARESDLPAIERIES